MSEYTEKEIILKMKLQEYDEALRKVELAYNIQMDGIRSEEQRITKVIESLELFNSESIIDDIRAVTIQNQRRCEIKYNIVIDNLRIAIKKIEEDLMKQRLDTY